MFLVRSAFWLTVAFMTIHPQNVDVGAAAASLSNQAVDAGKRIVVAQVLRDNCGVLRCAGPVANATAPETASLPSLRAGSVLPNQPLSSPVPYPRQRPSWMG
jgi:hypothetical protein